MNRMPAPKMIMFDYGQTLADEVPFDGIAGTRALLGYAAENKHDLTAEQVQEKADELNRELGRFDPEKRHLFTIEVPNYAFLAYLYGSLGIRLSLSPEEADRIFWDASSPALPSEGIADLLSFLKRRGIRTGVISNISYSGQTLKERIDKLLPDNEFEFIISTADHMFRKPSPRIFELGLIKAELSPKDVWYVGDNFGCDIIGAHNAGIFPVLYDGASAKKSDIAADFDFLHIHHWQELTDILSK